MNQRHEERSSRSSSVKDRFAKPNWTAIIKKTKDLGRYWKQYKANSGLVDWKGKDLKYSAYI